MYGDVIMVLMECKWSCKLVDACGDGGDQTEVLLGVMRREIL